MVVRVCKVLEDRREKREAARKAAAERKKETKSRQIARAAEARSQKYLWAGYNLLELWTRMLALPTSTAELGGRIPSLAIRRCSCAPRSRIGVAWYTQLRAQVSVWEGMDLRTLVDTMVHELAHLVSYARYDNDDGRGHGHAFRKTYTLLHREWRTLHPSIEIESSRWLLE